MSSDLQNSGGTAGMLDAERKLASFDSEALRSRIDSRNKREAIERFMPLFESAPFKGEEQDAFYSYSELFEKKMERVVEAFKIVRENPMFMVQHMAQKVQMGDMFEHNGIFLHFTMMLTYIKSQGDAEQQKYWLEKAQNGDFIAAYCQTELGHGSNVRGLETTAHFDVNTQEFEIHSPTLTSLKWWPTGMYACTHALVFAQLHSNGENHGFHGFMVQLRKSDGSLMPGVEVGEIGPKINQTSINIGYARFTRVRVPKNHLFSKYSDISTDGGYVAASRTLSKFRYISMMVARVAIIQIAYDMLAKAVTIAVRYSAVRLQGFKDGGTTENVVLDYQMQQHRTFKALSFAYCLFWNTKYIRDYMKAVRGAIDKGGADADAAAEDLPALHATLSGMKATSTVLSHESIEECRKCCGGQGFLSSSGIAKLSPDFSEWVTVEGEQVILSLQLARFLIKSVAELREGKEVSESVAYLGKLHMSDDDVRIETVTSDTPPGMVASSILTLLQHRSRKLSHRLSAKFQQVHGESESDSDGANNRTGANMNMSFDKALNSVAVLAYRAAQAHSVYFMLLNNFKAIEQYFESAEDAPLKAVLTRLFQLQGLMQIADAQPGEFEGLLHEDGYERAEDLIGTLLEEVRPDAVALVDSFGFLDFQLKSTLGRFDGNVYEAIYDEAKKNPLNQTENGTMVGWDKYSTVLDLEFLEETAKVQRAVGAKGSKARL